MALLSSDFARLKHWSRHHNYSTPKSMKDVWSTSYGNDYNGKKIGYYPDRTIVDYFSGERRWVPSRQSRQGDNLRTSLNDRAKSGFRYWVLDKPKVSHCKYKKNWKIWNWFI